jgi:hypothetical protein
VEDDIDDYTEIAVSRTMVSDHQPEQYYRVLHQVLCSYYLQE